jgi:tight adherence protein C
VDAKGRVASVITIPSRRILARLPRALAFGPPRSRVFVRIGAKVPGRLRGGAGDDAAGRKVCFALAGAVAASALGSFPTVVVVAPLLAGCGWRLPDMMAARRQSARREQVRGALPDLLDLLAVCALAGMGLDPALRLVAPGIGGPLGDSLRAMLNALAVGVPRDRAYDGLARTADADEVRRVVAALRRAERYGSSIAATLGQQAAEMRSRRRAAARERAHGAPVRLLFPLALCFLPAFVLLTVAPALIAAVRSLHGI